MKSVLHRLLGSLEAEPYFSAKQRHGRVETRGLTSCLLGHQTTTGANGQGQEVFAGWTWDGNCLTVRNDRYGFYPLYYFARDGEVAVSPSIPKLLKEGAPADIDAESMAVFLRLGFFIGEDTPFKAIKVIPPDAKFEWKEGVLTVQGRLSFGKEQTLSRQQALDGYIDLFAQAIRRRTFPAKKSAVPLSGGRDSRHILFALCDAGSPPDLTVTVRRYPPWQQADLDVAASVAQSVGVRHVLVEQNQSRARSELEKNFHTSFCTDEHAWILVLLDYLRDQVDVVYDGIGGDVLSAGLFLTRRKLALFREDRFEELAENLLKDDGILSSIVSLFPLEAKRSVAVERVAAELQRFRAAPDPIDAFFFWNRTRREIALSPYRLLSSVAEVYCPYLDHDLYDFLSTLPAEIVIDRQLHTEAIQRAYPQYAHIPFFDFTGDARLRSRNWAHLLRFSTDVQCYALSTQPTRALKTLRLLPQLAGSLIDRQYSISIGKLGPFLLYLLQIYNLQQHVSPAQIASVGERP